MSKINNPLWRMFASVKLTLVTLIILALTSIVGTLIQQKKTSAYYVEEYGQNLAKLFETLDFTDMYSSWWFIALLGLFVINLLVCSFERLPAVWRAITDDYLAIDLAELQRQRFSKKIDTTRSFDETAKAIPTLVAGSGWRHLTKRNRNTSLLFFAQSGRWSRLGVYIVHLSILIVLAGAVIGSLFGFKAYVFLPEGRATDQIFLQQNREPIPLGFELHKDDFEKVYYPNGMIKEFRTSLSVYEPGRQSPYQKTIIVNDPLTYNGITFYLADTFPLEEYFVVVKNLKTGQEQAFRMPADRDVSWEGTPVHFRLEELKLDQDGAVQQAKISFTDNDASPATVFWMKDKSTVNLNPSAEAYSFSFRQLYSTLLLANRDPGVWVVYAGCIMMLVGLAISFGFSHRRLWIRIEAQDHGGTQVWISGGTNKQRPAFEQRFNHLISQFKQLTSPSSGKGKKKKTRQA